MPLDFSPSSCSSAGCQKEHWRQHKEHCQPASSLLPLEVSLSRPSKNCDQEPLLKEHSSAAPEAPPKVPIEIGPPQLVQLPSSEGQEQAPLASHVIFPYDGYLQLIASSNTRLPLGMINCGNRCDQFCQACCIINRASCSLSLVSDQGMQILQR